FTLLIYEFIHNDTSTAEIYSLSLHDALPILEGGGRLGAVRPQGRRDHRRGERGAHRADHGHRDRGRAARAAAVPGPDLEDGGVNAGLRGHTEHQGQLVRARQGTGKTYDLMVDLVCEEPAVDRESVFHLDRKST